MKDIESIAKEAALACGKDDHMEDRVKASIRIFAPDTGGLFLSLPIPAVGEIVPVSPDKPSNNWENVIESIR